MMMGVSFLLADFPKNHSMVSLSRLADLAGSVFTAEWATHLEPAVFLQNYSS